MVAITSYRQSYVLLTSRPRNYVKIAKIGLAIVGLFYIFRVEKINHEMKTFHLKAFNWVAGKYDGEEDVHSQWHSTFPEKITPISKRKPDDQIRYAAFGSSITLGATLDNREKDAYVKKLSYDKGRNYGIRSSGPKYPAACTKSIMGDEEFDVIVLEFFTVANTGMMELAQRLRERFPDAIIVVARLWDPPMLENVNGQGLMSWAQEKGYGNAFIHSSNFKDEFLRSYSENQWQWRFETTHKEFVEVHEAIAKETGSYIVPMAWDTNAAGESGYLEIGDKMLGPDSFHLSVAGHEDFANRVKALVDRVGVPKHPKIGEFSISDYCLNWFQRDWRGFGV